MIRIPKNGLVDHTEVVRQAFLGCIVEQWNRHCSPVLVEVVAVEPSLTIINPWFGFLDYRCLGACVSDIGILPNHSLASERGRGVPDHVCICSSLIVVTMEYMMWVEDRLFYFPRTALDHVE